MLERKPLDIRLVKTGGAGGAGKMYTSAAGGTADMSTILFWKIPNRRYYMSTALYYGQKFTSGLPHLPPIFSPAAKAVNRFEQQNYDELGDGQ